MFTTERLILRPYQESDLEHLLRMHNNLRVQRTVTIDYIVPRGPKFQEKILELIYKPLLFVIVMLKETGMFIGLSSVNVGPGKNRDGTFGIVLHPDYWNKGYGTEVTKFIMDYSFRCLAMNRMSLAVLESNRAAIAIYEKVGFVQEGKKRQANWADGGWEDLFYMGILETEWVERNRTTQAT